MSIEVPPGRQERPLCVSELNRWLPIGEGLPPDAPGLESWIGRHMRLSEEDRGDLLREPCARYLIRERTRRDVRTHLTRYAEMRAIRRAGERRLPPTRRPQDPGARSLVVVFRSGHQLPFDEAPGFLVLSRAICEAERNLAACPALGADAIRDISPNLWLPPHATYNEPPAPVVCEFAYIDAPGDFSIGVYGVRLYKQFDARRLKIVDRYMFAAFQAMVDRWRGFDRKRLRDYSGPLVFPKHFLITLRRRR